MLVMQLVITSYEVIYGSWKQGFGFGVEIYIILGDRNTHCVSVANRNVVLYDDRTQCVSDFRNTVAHYHQKHEHGVLAQFISKFINSGHLSNCCLT